jgi:hypothetical protein
VRISSLKLEILRKQLLYCPSQDDKKTCYLLPVICYLIQGGFIMESIYLDREKLSEVKEMIIELGVSL